MSELLSSGKVVDLALAVMALELVVFVLLRKGQGWRLQPVDVLGQLLAGAMLLLAIRFALTGGDSRWILLFLTASFPAHLFDLSRRARHSARPS